MKVIVYPSDDGGCGRYRIKYPAKALADQGHDVRIAENMPYVKMMGTEVKAVMPIKADAVLFQRPCRRQIVDALRLIQLQGVKVMIDWDDDLTSIHPSNSAYGAYNYNEQDMHWRYGNTAAALADVNTVTTPRLQEVYGGIIVPNHIPESYLDIKKPDTGTLVTVGWAGFVGTHPDDLYITHGAIQQALAATKGNSRFLALGDPKALNALGVRSKEPNSWLPGVNINQYPEFVAQLDIGIVPLADSPFNQAKSWLKALEYASLGVVPVVSPTYDNMRLVEAGAAVPASSPKEWASVVTELIRDGERRQELSAKAREVASQWTVEGNTSKWASAWGLI